MEKNQKKLFEKVRFYITVSLKNSFYVTVTITQTLTQFVTV